MNRLLISLALAISATSVIAQTAFWNGDTTGGPTWNRPLSLSGLSGTGTNVPYQLQPFYVSLTGTYAFEVAGARPTTSFTHTDTYILVYGNSFSSATPLVNLLNGDDDYSGAFSLLSGNGSGFASSRIASGEGTNFAAGGLALSSGVQYYAVVTGFGNSDFGTYEAAIGGGSVTGLPGLVTLGTIPVPEPASMAILGMGALALLRRRRKG